MGQDLRVVAWLRFGNKAQLTKGLEAFSEGAAPEYYDVRSWEQNGLDAMLRLDTELPGDFTQVERPFMAMIKAATFGYIDYFERGNTKIFRGEAGPLKRWSAGHIDKKFTMPEGTSSLGWAGPEEELVLMGSFQYGDEKTPQALIERGFRLPFLCEREVRELRLEPGHFAVKGPELSLMLAASAPATLDEPLQELLRLLGTKAVSGAMTLQVPRYQALVSVKGKIKKTYTNPRIKADAGFSRVGATAL